MVARRGVLALFPDVDTAAEAVMGLREAGLERFEVLTGAPFPAGAFGEPEPRHRLYAFTLVGALVGLVVGVVAGVAVQAFPAGTEHTRVLSIPPTALITLAGVLTGAVLLTLVGFLAQVRAGRGPTDPRINREGMVALEVLCAPGQVARAAEVLRGAGAVEVREE